MPGTDGTGGIGLAWVWAFLMCFGGQWGRSRQGAGLTHSRNLGLLFFKALDFFDRRFYIFPTLLLTLIFLDEILDIIFAEFLYQELHVSFPFLDAWLPEMDDLRWKDLWEGFMRWSVHDEMSAVLG